VTLAQALIAELSDADLRDLARLLAPYLPATAPADPTTWLNTDQAADYLSCPRSRIHDLVQLHKLSPRRDGRRLVFKRADLDAYLERKLR
jgi:excisionase family DNA binding protein